MGNPYKPVELVIFEHFFFLNWDALHARLSNYYEAWIYKKNKKKKKMKGIQGSCLERTCR